MINPKSLKATKNYHRTITIIHHLTSKNDDTCPYNLFDFNSSPILESAMKIILDKDKPENLKDFYWRTEGNQLNSLRHIPNINCVSTSVDVSTLLDISAIYFICSVEPYYVMYVGSTSNLKNRFSPSEEEIEKRIKDGFDELLAKESIFHEVYNQRKIYGYASPIDSPDVWDDLCNNSSIFYFPCDDVGNGSKTERAFIRKFCPTFNNRHNPLIQKRVLNISNKLKEYGYYGQEALYALIEYTVSCFSEVPLIEFMDDWEFPYCLWENVLSDFTQE